MDGSAIDEGLLNGVQLAIRGLHAFDGDELLTKCIFNFQFAASDRLHIQQNGAGAANAYITAYLGACETQVLPEPIDQAFLQQFLGNFV